MKNLPIFLLFNFLIVCGTASAAPSNGTRFLPKHAVEFGYEYNLMYRRPLDRSYGILKTQDNFFTVSFGAFDWLVLDGKIGIGDQNVKGGMHLPKLEFRTGFAGGYGFRIKAFEHEKLGVRLILGAQHISVHPQDRSVDDDKFETFLDDWQVTGLVSKKFKYLTPYVGVKGSDCEFVYNINKSDKKRRYSEYHVGIICGSDFYLFEDKLRFNMELRFLDESAFSTAIAYLF